MLAVKLPCQALGYTETGMALHRGRARIFNRLGAGRLVYGNDVIWVYARKSVSYRFRGCSTTEMEMKRVGIYLRVSTTDQTTDNQRLDLERVASQRGWKVVEIYVDHGISGSKGRDKRPALDHLCKDATNGMLDLVAAWSVDRLGRSLQHVVTFLNELSAMNVDLYLHQQSVDSSTPGGKAMLSMCAVFAEFERNMIIERVSAGMARARSQGKVFGRPKKSTLVEMEIRRLRSLGHGIIKTSKLAGVGVSTVQRVISIPHCSR
jgi:DNA invertase Pin-like site-specific DNA recombinase